jgi:hypothetical protein
MAAAVLSSRRDVPRVVIRDTTRNTADLLPISLLPDSKEWIAEHDVEMLMLDG